MNLNFWIQTFHHTWAAESLEEHPLGRLLNDRAGGRIRAVNIRCASSAWTSNGQAFTGQPFNSQAFNGSTLDWCTLWGCTPRGWLHWWISFHRYTSRTEQTEERSLETANRSGQLICTILIMGQLISAEKSSPYRACPAFQWMHLQ